MADAPAAPIVETPVAAPAAPESVVAAPVVEAPVVETKVEPAAPVVEAPAAPVVEAPAVETKAEPSLLEQAGKKEDPPATEAKPEAPVAPAAEAPAVEWDFKLPETMKADDATLGKFKDNLNSLLKPAEGETPSHAAQRLLGMHNDALVQYDKLVREQQVKAWNDTKASWRTASLADPAIGGSGHQTAMGAIARVRDALVSDARVGTKAYDRDVGELNAFLAATGAGDHPVFLKILHRAARYIDEPSAPSVKASPPPDAGRKPGRSLYAE